MQHSLFDFVLSCYSCTLQRSHLVFDFLSSSSPAAASLQPPTWCSEPSREQKASLGPASCVLFTDTSNMVRPQTKRLPTALKHQRDQQWWLLVVCSNRSQAIVTSKVEKCSFNLNFHQTAIFGKCSQQSALQVPRFIIQEQLNFLDVAECWKTFHQQFTFSSCQHSEQDT